MLLSSNTLTRRVWSSCNLTINVSLLTEGYLRISPCFTSSKWATKRGGGRYDLVSEKYKTVLCMPGAVILNRARGKKRENPAGMGKKVSSMQATTTHLWLFSLSGICNKQWPSEIYIIHTIHVEWDIRGQSSFIARLSKNMTQESLVLLHGWDLWKATWRGFSSVHSNAKSL